jgi:hypothetical protein
LALRGRGIEPPSIGHIVTFWYNAPSFDWTDITISQTIHTVNTQFINILHKWATRQEGLQAAQVLCLV